MDDTFAVLRRTEAKDATSREVRIRESMKLLFALKIFAPDRFPNDFIAQESEELLKLDPWAFGWHNSEISTDEVILRSMVHVIKSPNVHVDQSGLHIQRKKEQDIASPAPFPIRKHI